MSVFVIGLDWNGTKIGTEVMGGLTPTSVYVGTERPAGCPVFWRRPDADGAARDEVLGYMPTMAAASDAVERVIRALAQDEDVGGAPVVDLTDAGAERVTAAAESAPAGPKWPCGLAVQVGDRFSYFGGVGRSAGRVLVVSDVRQDGTVISGDASSALGWHGHALTQCTIICRAPCS